MQYVRFCGVCQKRGRPTKGLLSDIGSSAKDENEGRHKFEVWGIIARHSREHNKSNEGGKIGEGI